MNINEIMVALINVVWVVTREVLHFPQCIASNGILSYVMWSSKISLMSSTIKFQICTLFGKALRKLYFAENLIEVMVPKIFSQFCPVENNNIYVQQEFHTMYIKINIPDIILILLDHLTYKNIHEIMVCSN